MRPKFVICLGILLLGALPGFTQTGGEVSDDKRIKVGNGRPPMTLSLWVADKKGNPVTGLKASDFKIFEDGKSQTVAGFVGADDIPRRIVFVVDVSGSSKAESFSIPSVLDAAMRLIRPNLRAGKDKLALLTFSTQADLKQDFTDDPALLKAALNRSTYWGPTSLYDALAAASNLLGKEPGRRLIVLVSDGKDNKSSISPDQMVRVITVNEVKVFGVHIPLFETPPFSRSPSLDVLETISKETGGRLLNGKRLGAEFQKLRTELDSEQSITYQLSGGSENAQVQIETLNKNYKIKYIWRY